MSASLAAVAIAVMLAGQSAAFGQSQLLPVWTPSVEPCWVGAHNSYVPDHRDSKKTDYNSDRASQGSAFCRIEVSIREGRQVSVERGLAILEEVLPRAERGELESSYVTHSGCIALRVGNYAFVVVLQPPSYCPGAVQPRFLGASISELRIVFR